MNNLKKKNGITLVALVITIIIMLILAGVAISVLTTDGRLFDKTRGAAETYNEAVKNEANQIEYFQNKMENYLNGVNSGSNGVAIATQVQVGDYVNYNAGVWTEEDFTKITSSTGNPNVNRSVSKPTAQGEFGGFALNKSRNENSTPYIGSPRTEGWRVWDIDTVTGAVTLVSAGHPETYYHGTESSKSIEILLNRDYSMYVNNKATNAEVLTAEEAVRWYNKNFNTDYTIIEYGNGSSTFYAHIYEPSDLAASMLDNGAYIWMASAYDTANLYDNNPTYRAMGADYNGAFGIRILVLLDEKVTLELNSGDGSAGAPWQIAD